MDKSTIVLPAVTHLNEPGKNLSELSVFCVSTVSTVPSGSNSHPSSENVSALPVPLRVQPRVFALKKAVAMLKFWPSMKVPLGRTIPGESPMSDQPFGGLTFVHLFLTGS